VHSRVCARACGGTGVEAEQWGRDVRGPRGSGAPPRAPGSGVATGRVSMIGEGRVEDGRGLECLSVGCSVYGLVLPVRFGLPMP
jgi:hypothetical protein